MTQFGTIENDVLFGLDGELFLASGGHHVVDYSTGRLLVEAAVVEVFRANIEARAAYAKRSGATYLHVIFPDKQSVIPDRFVVPNPVRLGVEYLDRIGAVREHVFYPLDLLRSSDRSPFLKTDTHLSHFGTIKVVHRIAECLTGLDFAGDLAPLLAMLTLHRGHVGDLGIKLEPPHEANEVFARVGWRRLFFHNGIPGGNNGNVDIYFSPGARFDKRLLWFGDSFGRDAVNFLSYFFSEILFLRTPFFHPEFVDQMQPDFVVSENVERYLASCVPDERRPLFHMFPFLNNRTYHADRVFAEAFSAILSYPRPPYFEFLVKLRSALRPAPKISE